MGHIHAGAANQVDALGIRAHLFPDCTACAKGNCAAHRGSYRALVWEHLQRHPDHDLIDRIRGTLAPKPKGPPMDLTELPATLQAPDNSDVQLALGRIVTASGLQPAQLVPELYDPSNREVLDLLRQPANADTITAAWERLHPMINVPTQAPPVPASFTIDAPKEGTSEVSTPGETPSGGTETPTTSPSDPFPPKPEAPAAPVAEAPAPVEAPAESMSPKDHVRVYLEQALALLEDV